MKLEDEFDQLYRFYLERELSQTPNLLQRNPDGTYLYHETRLRWQGFVMSKTLIGARTVELNDTKLKVQQALTHLDAGEPELARTVLGVAADQWVKP